MSWSAVALPVPRSHAAEARALLSWMHDGHFVFLGYRHYHLKRGRSRDVLVRDPDSGLGILRGSSRRGGRQTPIVLTGHLRNKAREPDLLVLTKANTPSTVHRASYLDYVGIKTFDAAGSVNGEHRFLGLWTSSAYHSSPAEIPLLRRKLDAVIQHFDLPPQSHDAKAVVNVIENFPRDELFQMSTAELIASVRGIVNLYERRRVRLFARRDAYERFYSCLVYVPRDRYNTEVRERIERIVRQRFGGTDVESQVQISDSNLARLHLLVRTPQGARAVEDVAAVEEEIAAAAATWEDRLQQALISRGVARDAVELANRHARMFPPGYRAEVEPAQALDDIADLEALAADPAVPQLNLRAHAGAPANHVHLRILRSGGLIPISDILPMLENFGLRVLEEHNYSLTALEHGVVIQDFLLEARDLKRADFAALEPLFKEAFLAAWRGEIENDGFNRLLLCAGLSAREIVVLRAYCRYLLQTGIPFSQAYMERVAVSQAPIARQLVRLFQTQFALDARTREGSAERIRQAIVRALDQVASLDEDRILRAYLSVIRATLRTNYYQTTPDGALKSWVSFKLDPQAIPELPLPRPKFEIFVYSPRVEGVHLRMGYVARGGIRWSDRREDFRTEVLGLMKAQNVKNTVIVPVGAKGGFYPKRLPAGGSREEVQKEGIASYQTFIRGLLDVTDNIVGGKTVAARDVVRRDGDDAYLVVAADKGTATFSDIANAISIEYGHWLGDAFASGGSAGYDHKGMGITARGAWECVKRHFRELGLDIQASEFTCAGIGDMSGDVFGNGMLLSKHTRLVAAFDHRHIFLDPNPNAAASFRERERLFKLPRSSWDDYSRKLISRGGGVWPRSAKSIQLSAEARALLGLEAAAATPVEVMRAVLRMPVDLLWNGGIGTYVKAHDETHADAHDRANDAIRADGREVRARVIGEGGNLGCTQRGRVEYAQFGGLRKVRRPHQYGFHRQLGRREHLGRRGEHQDPDGGRGAQGPPDPGGARQTARQHDRRSRRAGTAQQLPAEPGPVGTRAARARAPHRVPEPGARAGARWTAEPRHRIPARRGGVRRAAQTTPGPDAPRARRGAGLQQDLAQQSPAGFRPARRSVFCQRGAALLSSAFAPEACARDHAPSPQARDRRDTDHQQPGEPHGAGVRDARAGRHGGDAGRHRPRLHHRPRSVFDARALGRHRGARQPRAGRRSVRHVLSHRPAAAARELLAAAQS